MLSRCIAPKIVDVSRLVYNITLKEFAMLSKILLIGRYVSFSEGPTLKRKPTPPKNGRRASEEDKAETEEEQELVTVTKVVEEVISGFYCFVTYDGYL